MNDYSNKINILSNIILNQNKKDDIIINDFSNFDKLQNIMSNKDKLLKEDEILHDKYIPISDKLINNKENLNKNKLFYDNNIPKFNLKYNQLLKCDFKSEKNTRIMDIFDKITTDKNRFNVSKFNDESFKEDIYNFANKYKNCLS